MSQTLINWNDIKRKLSLELDIDTIVSYEDFCYDREYRPLLKKMRDMDTAPHIAAFICLVYERVAAMRKEVMDKLKLLTMFDITEEYIWKEKGHDVWNVLWKKNTKPSTIGWFQSRATNPPLNTDPYLNIVKHHITDNYLVFNKKKREELHLTDTMSRSPESIRSFKESKGEDNYYQEGEEIKKQVQYNEHLTPHRKMEYISFISLLSDEPLYFLVDTDGSSFHIVSGTKLSKYIQSVSIVQRINSFLDIGQTEWRLLLEKLKEIYNQVNMDNKLREKVMTHMEEQLKTLPKIEFHLSTKHKKIDSIINIVTENNPKNFHKTQKKLPWEYIGFEEKILPEKWKQRIYKSKTKL